MLLWNCHFCNNRHELKLTKLEQFAFSGLYLVLFSFLSTWNRLKWKSNITLILTSNVSNYWSKYFLISDSNIVKSEFLYRWIVFPCSKWLLMTKIVLQCVLTKTVCQDIWNFMLKEKLNCFDGYIYSNFKSSICLLVSERFTFRISGKTPWTLFNGCQTIFRILQENISKPWKSWKS